MTRCATVYKDTPRDREKDRVGKQCGAQAVNGTPYCKFHGGNSSQVIDKSRVDRIEAEVIDQIAKDKGTGGFTDVWDETHELLDPFSLLLWEIRRSGARIEWFDRQLDLLGREKDIWWGETKRERINAAEFTGTNRTYEARENVLVKMQNEERKRLKELRDEWQNNKFEALKIAGFGAFRTSMRAALAAVMSEFEIDASDPEIQGRLRGALEALPEPIVGIEAPTLKELARG